MSGNERGQGNGARNGKVSRRAVVKAGGALALAAAAAPIIGPAQRSAAATAAQAALVEPPFFAERVAAGQLPPIDQRLPAERFTVGPGVLLQEEYMTWENGQYGGDLKAAGLSPTNIVRIGFGATILRSPSQTTSEARPNVVSAFSFSEDYTTFRFTIRDGLKWSDGTPVTTEDVRFTFEDLYMDPEVLRPYPTDLYTQGNTQLEPAALKVVDKLSFELTFSKPYGYFIAPLHSWIPGYDFIFKPAHYLKQFHKKYAAEADLASRLQENNETNWVTLLQAKDASHWDVGELPAMGLPTLNAWVMTQADEQSRVFERNPYYWHVDSAGLQLPYADRVLNTVTTDVQSITNILIAGQINFASAEDVSLNEMPLYVQNAERAGIRPFTTASFNWPVLLFLNHDFQYEDPNSVWQTLVADPERRFGKALAAAINPEDINQSVYFGLFGEPVMYAGAYNTAQAEQLLDAVGMNQRAGDGSRLGPDGQPFVLRITNNNVQADFPPILELLREQLGVVGIRVEIETVAVTLWDQRKEANEIMASIFWNDGPGWPSGVSEDYLPNHKGPWSPLTWQYFTSGGQQGRKPPAYIEEFYRIHTERKQFPPESPEGQQAYQALLQWMEANYVMIPTAGQKVSANVVGANLRNVPNEGAPCNLDTYINAEGVWFAQP